MHVKSLEQLKQLKSYFDPDALLSFDLETTGLDFLTCDITGICLYDGTNEGVFIHLNFEARYFTKEQDPNNKRRKIQVWHHYERTDAIDFEEAKPYIIELLKGREVIGHNLKFDKKVSRAKGIDCFIIKHDTMVMSYLVDVNFPNGLKENTKRYLKRDVMTYEEAVGMKPDNIDWNKVDFHQYGEYGIADVINPVDLAKIFLPMMENMKVMKTYEKLEMPIVPIVADMEYLGVQIEPETLHELSNKAEAQLAIDSEEIYDVAGVEFNIGSTKQLAEVLYDRMGYKCRHLTSSGGRSVAEDALKELSFIGAEIADLLLDYRSLDKLNGTYLKSIPTMLDANGRLHGGFNQCGTRTGRFSSSQPNLQNQPNNPLYPVRSSFVASKGKRLIVADWSTIEIRIMAHHSEDPVLLDLLRNGHDLHQETADRISKLTGLKLSRSEGKTLNFAILYGMMEDSLAATINKGLRAQVKAGEISYDEYRKRFRTPQQCKSIIQGFHASYKGYSRWSDAVVNGAKQRGYVRTLGGRVRALPELNRPKQYGEGARKAVNTKIQGGAGDLMKKGIQDLHTMFKERGYDANLLMVVHDEYVIEVDERQAEACWADAKKVMENVFPTCLVPIVADGGIFTSWAGMKLGEESPDFYPDSFTDLWLSGILTN